MNAWLQLAIYPFPFALDIMSLEAHADKMDDGPPEHDWLQPFSALSIGQALSKGAGVSSNHRLSKLVAVRRCSVAGIYEDLH